jgi:hypothetical protein
MPLETDHVALTLAVAGLAGERVLAGLILLIDALRSSNQAARTPPADRSHTGGP